VVLLGRDAGGQPQPSGVYPLGHQQVFLAAHAAEWVLTSIDSNRESVLEQTPYHRQRGLLLPAFVQSGSSAVKTRHSDVLHRAN
jgi:hypothetical protein